jgi:KDO2-lipid IV(A) lauroyltransferase
MSRALGFRRARGLVPRYYEHLGLLVAEFARMRFRTPEDVSRWIEPDGIERLREVVSRGRGVIALTGHIGNWELAGHCIAANGVPTHALYRPLSNPYLDRRLQRLRASSGMRLRGKRDALRALVRVLRSGEVAGILLDQDGGRQGVFCPFFGKLGSTLPTAAVLAMHTGAAIVPVTCYRCPSREGHRLRVGQEVRLASTGDEERDALITTRRCNEALERAILEHPEQWLWVHRRWNVKPKPEDAQKWREVQRWMASARRGPSR